MAEKKLHALFPYHQTDASNALEVIKLLSLRTLRMTKPRER